MPHSTYVDFHRERLARRRAERAKAAERVRARLPQVVRTLQEHGARRVILFGSLATGAFDEESDVDIAVEGLSPGRFIEAASAASLVAGIPVDLVCIERAPDRLRARIADEGEALL